MTYPGNSSLAADIRERIAETFEQTLDMAAMGDSNGAASGCDFVLRLDPLFEPARVLKKRLAEASGPVEVSDLRLDEAAPAGGDIFDLSSRQPEATETPPAPAPQPAATEPSADELFSDSDEQSFDDVDVSELESALDFSGLTDAAPSDSAADSDPTPDPTPEPEPEPVAAAPEAVPAVDQQQELDPLVSGDTQPEVPLDAESEQRVAELLQNGQEAFDRKEYQSAIDSWSRIFLIDIDHPEANRRIEQARKHKAEVERQVEELYHEAVESLESGDLDTASAGFSRVLAIQPTHLAAQEYHDKIESGSLMRRDIERAGIKATGSDSEPEFEDTSGAAATAGMTVEAEVPGVDEEDMYQPPPPPAAPDEAETEPEVEPAREREPAPPRAAPKKAAAGGRSRRLLYIGGGVLVLAAAIGWFLYRNFDDTFPNASPSPVSRPRVDPIARAQAVYDNGDAALAVAQLKRVPPAHPRYAEAQALIAQWEAPAEGDAKEEEAVTEEQLAERDRLVGEAQSAFDRREYLRSHELLSQAAGLASLEEDAARLQAAAALELQPLRSEIEIFRQGEWAEALRSLWRVREDDPGNPDIQRLMVDSYFNLGVRDLQRHDPGAAVANFREAQTLAGSDSEVERLLGFAETYQSRAPDLLYRIFVKYQPFR